MVSSEDLKAIYLLQPFSGPMLERMLPLILYRECEEGEVVFEEGEPAEYFYMLRRGKVILEVDLSPSVSMALGAIKPGYSFGWSALSQNDRMHKSRAICTEPSEIFCIPGPDFVSLLDQNPAVGYRVMKEVFHIFKARLERRTIQLVSVMRKHPDMRELLEKNP